jgi:predicted O-linked N-acetylglucosamine transferase (SPINDLY family)
VFLDAWPCNAHTTAGEALWCGVPVVTIEGRTFAQRVASSLLHAVGHDELVAHDVAGYRRIVLALAGDPARRRSLGDALRAARPTSRLFDGARFARDIEALYRRMWQRAVAGQRPDHLAAVDVATEGSAA